MVSIKTNRQDHNQLSEGTTRTKEYIFEVTITESSDKVWEGMEGKTGCNEVLSAVRDCLDSMGWTEGENCHVELKRYENKP